MRGLSRARAATTAAARPPTPTPISTLVVAIPSSVFRTTPSSSSSSRAFSSSLTLSRPQLSPASFPLLASSSSSFSSFSSSSPLARSFSSPSSSSSSTTPFALHVYRSLWGTEGFSTDYERLLPELKRLGYDGVEASLGDASLGPLSTKEQNQKRFVQLLRRNGLRWICGVYTSWQDYEGEWPGPLPVETHLTQYKTQLTQATGFGDVVVHINVHSGSDHWSREDNEKFYRSAQSLECSLGLQETLVAGGGRSDAIGVSHETHRGRSLFNPWITAHLCHKFPDLRITADYSHWMVVAERLLNTSYDREVFAALAPKVAHVHARMGHVQHAQLTLPQDPLFAGEVAMYDSWWSAIWRAQRGRGRAWSTVTPEYGPPPYTPTMPLTGAPLSDCWQVTNTEAHRLRIRFAQQPLSYPPPS